MPCAVVAQSTCSATPTRRRSTSCTSATVGASALSSLNKTCHDDDPAAAHDLSESVRLLQMLGEDHGPLLSLAPTVNALSMLGAWQHVNRCWSQALSNPNTVAITFLRELAKQLHNRLCREVDAAPGFCCWITTCHVGRIVLVCTKP